MNQDQLQRKRDREKQVVREMIALYCRKNHRHPD